jgi:hypothetical protein
VLRVGLLLFSIQPTVKFDDGASRKVQLCSIFDVEQRVEGRGMTCCSCMVVQGNHKFSARIEQMRRELMLISVEQSDQQKNEVIWPSGVHIDGDDDSL